VRTSKKVLMEVDDNCVQIVGNPKGILGQQLSLRQLDIIK
jgi:hypothetical protein